jgi:hypothetical protein
MSDSLPSSTQTTATIERNAVFQYIKTMLGDGMVDLEFDPVHLETSLDRAINYYRQRSANSVEESYLFLELQQDQNEYRLPDEVISVRQVFRRAIGSRSGIGAGGTLFEPFNLAYTNTYLMSGSMMGGLATYDAFAGYQKLVGRMFGSFIEFQFKQTTHILNILQRPFAQGEQLLVQSYNFRPDWVLLQDPNAKQWLRDYSLAVAKEILGQARSKFASIAGPQGGGMQLNGATLIAESKEMITKLEKEIETNAAGGFTGYFIIG